jgi:hypothetical protein
VNWVRAIERRRLVKQLAVEAGSESHFRFVQKLIADRRQDVFELALTYKLEQSITWYRKTKGWVNRSGPFDYNSMNDFARELGLYGLSVLRPEQGLAQSLKMIDSDPSPLVRDRAAQIIAQTKDLRFKQFLESRKVKQEHLDTLQNIDWWALEHYKDKTYESRQGTAEWILDKLKAPGGEREAGLLGTPAVRQSAIHEMAAALGMYGRYWILQNKHLLPSAYIRSSPTLIWFPQMLIEENPYSDISNITGIYKVYYWLATDLQLMRGYSEASPEVRH